jgi:hypothetical protein
MLSVLRIQVTERVVAVGLFVRTIVGRSTAARLCAQERLRHSRRMIVCVGAVKTLIDQVVRVVKTPIGIVLVTLINHVGYDKAGRLQT